MMIRTTLVLAVLVAVFSVSANADDSVAELKTRIVELEAQVDAHNAERAATTS
jgi:hypothetical protein